MTRRIFLLVVIVGLLIPAIALTAGLQKDADGVIFDPGTGLEWCAGPDQDTNWEQARDWAGKLSTAGGGWRLPTLAELRGLYRKGIAPNNIDPVFGMQNQDLLVWSSETNGPSSVYFFIFTDGSEYWTYPMYSYYTRALAVRSKK